MPEFQEVMRRLNRLCSHYQNCSESGCPMFDECGNIGAYCSGPKQSCRIEKTVMEWAAENHEPVYPKWGEWLLQTCQVGITADGKNDWDGLLLSHIPADLAQKLGIEPKLPGSPKEE